MPAKKTDKTKEVIEDVTADTTAEATKLSVEEGFEALQEILSQMEEEDLPIETSFALYEQGMKLVKQCNEQIDRVEKKVQMITKDGSLTDFTEEA